ncbi:MAG: energy transducer TonB [Bacteroidota bacterium]|nr:energy transducer TonB [Bacteroidota bacterium]
MKPKKTPKADIDKDVGLYFKIGLSIAIAFVILAFQWTVYDKDDTKLDSNLIIDEDEEIIDVTKQEKKIKIPPPPPELKIVEDNIEIEEDEPEIETQDDIKEVAIELPDVLPEEEEVSEEKIFMVVENMPEYPGGDRARDIFLRDNIKYPEMERDNGIQGLVVVSFIVEKNGKLTNIKILGGQTPNLNNEAKRVVRLMPNWKPGKQRGKSVRVTINLPIRFTLR